MICLLVLCFLKGCKPGLVTMKFDLFQNILILVTAISFDDLHNRVHEHCNQGHSNDYNFYKWPNWFPLTFSSLHCA